MGDGDFWGADGELTARFALRVGGVAATAEGETAAALPATGALAWAEGAAAGMGVARIAAIAWSRAL